MISTQPLASDALPRSIVKRFKSIGFAIACLAISQALHAAPSEDVLKGQARLSIYFSSGPDEYARRPDALSENAFAFVGLDRHVLTESELPTPQFADPAKAAPFYPDGVDLTATFYNDQGETVTSMDEPGFYGADISIQATEGRRFTIRRILLKLPDGAPQPEDVSEAEALRRLAKKKLGHPWTIKDPSLYTYHNQWFWDLDTAMGEADTLEYLAFYPPNYETQRAQGTKFPLYIHLHGSGAMRLDYEQYVSDPFLQTFQAYADQGMVVVTPLSHSQWQSPPVKELLQRLQSEMSIDPKRIILGGHSMGASGTWRILDATPEPFAAAVLVAGGNVPPLNKANRYTGLPMWVVFGENDNPDGQARSEAMTEAINHQGGQARYTLMPEANHMQSRNRFFPEATLIDWMLSQEKD